MSLAAGTKLGRYEIRSKIGEGGMGEVYRARDEKLSRDVAIKVIPASLAQDDNRLRRFEQEAQATGSLNHPNILAVYDVGTHDGIAFVVCELLEGVTLRERLNTGKPPLTEAINYAIQIARGLASAHERGIVHRDLKPENIFITKDDQAKILDFGLAKLVEHRDSDAHQTEIPTYEKQTQPGTVMGTVGYMSPEQVQAKPVDHRSDIFSFGAVLYEMLTGERAFRRESAVETLNAILKEEPDEISNINATVPSALERIVRHCLEKTRERRFQSATDVAFALESISEASTLTKSQPVSAVKNRAQLLWLVAMGLLLLTAVALGYNYFRSRPAESATYRLSLALPENMSSASLAVSPNGRWLAFTGATGGRTQLWLRELNKTVAQKIEATDGAEYPFWSPDSHLVGFFSDGKLKKVSISGGPVQTICDVGTGRGGSWNPDGVIVFGVSGFGLYRVLATGEEPTILRAFDRERQESVYHSPSFLPDGHHFLFYIQSGRKDIRGVYLGSLDDVKLKTKLLDADRNGVYSPPGYILFGREGALVAQPFDAEKFTLTGEAVPVADTVGSDPNLDRGNFSVSENGVLVYDGSTKRQRKQLIWKDRSGKSLGLGALDGGYTIVRISPDGNRAATDRFNSQTGSYDIWVDSLNGNGGSRFTFDASDDVQPMWSPDGSRIVWASTQQGVVHDLYQKASSGAGQDELLLKTDKRKFPSDWSSDGRFIVYYELDPNTKRDIWVLPTDRSQKPFPFLRTVANETGARLSPDGRWIAYTSDESGRYEIYVRSFPDSQAQWQVSTTGGVGPHWRRDGKELFYYSADGKIMAIQIKSDPTFQAANHISLFEFPSGNGIPFLAPFAVTQDGQRFLLNTLVDESNGAPLTVVLNWTANLKR